MVVSQSQVRFRWIALLLGPLLGFVTWWAMPEVEGSALVARTAGVAVWMAVWWLSEAVPLAVTSLLPLVLFPLTGVLPSRHVATLYTNDIVFLFIGGFIVALAMERWKLHKRIALLVILAVGGGPVRTLFGFMLATSLLSMWISNTATAMMMVPIAGAVLLRWDELYPEKQARTFAIALLLGIAYSASVGGIATLVGTPPNLVFAQLFHQQFENAEPVSFVQWMGFALPFSLIFLVIVWGLLTLMYMRGVKIQAGAWGVFQRELASLGRMSHEEKSVLTVFVALAFLWVFRSPIETGALTIPGWSGLLPEPGYAGDGTAAIALGVLLFVLPAKSRPGERIMDWETARQLPWRIVLLFGGGFALAGAIQTSGLADWIGVQMQGLSILPPILTTASISLLVTFLTELTSNTATSQMAMPILGALSVALERNPYFLMIPATLAASCAFMMPVATPPNAIVFGTGRLRIADMAKTGLILNLIGVLLITLWMHLAGPVHFGGVEEQPSGHTFQMMQE